MAKPQKIENDFTTISIRKVDKQRLRGLARFIKKTKNGELYESDAVVFNRIIVQIPADNTVPHNTYPTKKNISGSSLSSQGESQQDSSL